MMAPALQVVFPDVQVGCHLIEEVECPAFFPLLELLLVISQELCIFPIFFFRPLFKTTTFIPHILFDLPWNVDELTFFFILNFGSKNFSIHFSLLIVLYKLLYKTKDNTDLKQFLALQVSSHNLFFNVMAQDPFSVKNRNKEHYTSPIQ